MPDLLALSARFVDEGTDDGPGSTNRVTGELSEVADGVAVVESFSHVVALRTAAGLVLFDSTHELLAEQALRSLRGWSDAPVHTVVYTHGHVDHVGGAGRIVAEADAAGRPRPAVVAHELVPVRFDRYERTDGYNLAANRRQFGRRGLGLERDRFSRAWVRPTQTYDGRTTLRAGDTTVELRHARGETDDHSWAWLPEQRAVCTGDLVVWVFPNAGNPQKVQRYPLEWAHALREMAALEPELLLPAHGLPVGGRARIRTVLDDTATVLESVTGQVLELMNAGARLDTIVHAVRPPADLLDRPYLRPIYDEPEFVVRNVWRLYGGWWDGSPDRLKPAPDAAVAAEVAALAGGPEALARRAEVVAESGDLRLACHLAEWAGLAAPDDAAVHRARAAVYRRRRGEELSLMARGIYGTAAAESEARLGAPPEDTADR